MRRICPRRLCRRGARRGPVRGPGPVNECLELHRASEAVYFEQAASRCWSRSAVVLRGVIFRRPARCSRTTSQIRLELLFKTEFANHSGALLFVSLRILIGPPTAGSNREYSSMAILRADAASSAVGTRPSFIKASLRKAGFLFEMYPEFKRVLGKIGDFGQMLGFTSRKPGEML